jgi:ABC-type multidrug transport system ATPase subunit
VSFSQPPPADRQPAPAIVLTEVTKLFGRFAALRGVSAEFAPARLYLILGDNGAGKSTLLRAIAGLMRPSRGSVSALGSARLRSVAADIGYMAHAPLLYDEMDGMENLRYFARLYGITGDQRCAEAMRAVGLDPALPRRVGQYSQGMRQRLSLARAILNDPAIVLLDEPFSNVDIVSAREMVRLLAEMRDGGKTVFVVTHQPALLEGVADESVTMNAGQIVAREFATTRRELQPRGPL